MHPWLRCLFCAWTVAAHSQDTIQCAKDCLKHDAGGLNSLIHVGRARHLLACGETDDGEVATDWQNMSTWDAYIWFVAIFAQLGFGCASCCCGWCVHTRCVQQELDLATFRSFTLHSPFARALTGLRGRTTNIAAADASADSVTKEPQMTDIERDMMQAISIRTSDIASSEVNNTGTSSSHSHIPVITPQFSGTPGSKDASCSQIELDVLVRQFTHTPTSADVQQLADEPYAHAVVRRRHPKAHVAEDAAEAYCAPLNDKTMPTLLESPKPPTPPLLCPKPPATELQTFAQMRLDVIVEEDEDMLSPTSLSNKVSDVE